MEREERGTGEDWDASRDRAREVDQRFAARSGMVQVATALGQALSPLTQILLARLFGTAIFGAYQASLNLLEVLFRGGTGGADKAMLRYVAAHRARGDEAAVTSALGSGLRLCLLVAGSLAVLLALLASTVARWFAAPGLATPLRAMAPAVLLISTVYVLVQASLGAKVTRANLAVRGLGEPALLLLAGVGAALIQRTLLALAVAYSVAEASTLVLAVVAVGRVFGAGRLRAALRAPRLAGFATFALPIGAAELLNAIRQRADVVLVAAFEGAAAAGIYAAGEMLGRAIVGIRWAFDSVAASVLSESLELGQRERLRYNLALMTRWVASVAAPATALILVLRHDLLRLYGDSFVAGATAMAVLAVSHLANAVLGLAQWTLMASGRSRLLLLNNAVGAGVNVLLGVLLIPRLHAVGMAVAVLSDTLLFHSLTLIETWRTERVHPFEPALLAPFASSLVIPLVHVLSGVWLGGAARVATVTLVGVPAYLGLLALGLPDESRRVIRRLRPPLPKPGEPFR
jgi:O-antigen/teichoic acid export membrane protein